MTFAQFMAIALPWISPGAPEWQRLEAAYTAGQNNQPIPPQRTKPDYMSAEAAYNAGRDSNTKTV